MSIGSALAAIPALTSALGGKDDYGVYCSYKRQALHRAVQPPSPDWRSSAPTAVWRCATPAMIAASRAALGMPLSVAAAAPWRLAQTGQPLVVAGPCQAPLREAVLSSLAAVRSPADKVVVVECGATRFAHSLRTVLLFLCRKVASLLNLPTPTQLRTPLGSCARLPSPAQTPGTPAAAAAASARPSTAPAAPAGGADGKPGNSKGGAASAEHAYRSQESAAPIGEPELVSMLTRLLHDSGRAMLKGADGLPAHVIHVCLLDLHLVRSTAFEHPMQWIPSDLPAHVRLTATVDIPDTDGRLLVPPLEVLLFQAAAQLLQGTDPDEQSPKLALQAARAAAGTKDVAPQAAGHSAPAASPNDSEVTQHAAARAAEESYYLDTCVQRLAMFPQEENLAWALRSLQVPSMGEHFEGMSMDAVAWLPGGAEVLHAWDAVHSSVRTEFAAQYPDLGPSLGVSPGVRPSSNGLAAVALPLLARPTSTLDGLHSACLREALARSWPVLVVDGAAWRRESYASACAMLAPPQPSPTHSVSLALQRCAEAAAHHVLSFADALDAPCHGTLLDVLIPETSNCSSSSSNNSNNGEYESCEGSGSTADQPAATGIRIRASSTSSPVDSLGCPSWIPGEAWLMLHRTVLAGVLPLRMATLLCRVFAWNAAGQACASLLRGEPAPQAVDDALWQRVQWPFQQLLADWLQPAMATSGSRSGHARTALVSAVHAAALRELLCPECPAHWAVAMLSTGDGIPPEVVMHGSFSADGTTSPAPSQKPTPQKQRPRLPGTRAAPLNGLEFTLCTLWIARDVPAEDMLRAHVRNLGAAGGAWLDVAWAKASEGQACPLAAGTRAQATVWGAALVAATMSSATSAEATAWALRLGQAAAAARTTAQADADSILLPSQRARPVGQLQQQLPTRDSQLTPSLHMPDSALFSAAARPGRVGWDDFDGSSSSHSNSSEGTRPSLAQARRTRASMVVALDTAKVLRQTREQPQADLPKRRHDLVTVQGLTAEQASIGIRAHLATLRVLLAAQAQELPPAPQPRASSLQLLGLGPAPTLHQALHVAPRDTAFRAALWRWAAVAMLAAMYGERAAGGPLRWLAVHTSSAGPVALMPSTGPAAEPGIALSAAAETLTACLGWPASSCALPAESPTSSSRPGSSSCHSRSPHRSSAKVSGKRARAQLRGNQSLLQQLPAHGIHAMLAHPAAARRLLMPGARARQAPDPRGSPKPSGTPLAAHIQAAVGMQQLLGQAGTLWVTAVRRAWASVLQVQLHCAKRVRSAESKTADTKLTLEVPGTAWWSKSYRSECGTMSWLSRELVWQVTALAANRDSVALLAPSWACTSLGALVAANARTCCEEGDMVLAKVPRAARALWEAGPQAAPAKPVMRAICSGILAGHLDTGGGAGAAELRTLLSDPDLLLMLWGADTSTLAPMLGRALRFSTTSASQAGEDGMLMRADAPAAGRTARSNSTDTAEHEMLDTVLQSPQAQHLQRRMQRLLLHRDERSTPANGAAPQLQQQAVTAPTRQAQSSWTAPTSALELAASLPWLDGPLDAWLDGLSPGAFVGVPDAHMGAGASTEAESGMCCLCSADITRGEVVEAWAMLSGLALQPTRGFMLDLAPTSTCLLALEHLAHDAQQQQPQPPLSQSGPGQEEPAQLTLLNTADVVYLASGDMGTGVHGDMAMCLLAPAAAVPVESWPRPVAFQLDGTRYAAHQRLLCSATAGCVGYAAIQAVRAAKVQLAPGLHTIPLPSPASENRAKLYAHLDPVHELSHALDKWWAAYSAVSKRIEQRAVTMAVHADLLFVLGVLEGNAVAESKFMQAELHRRKLVKRSQRLTEMLLAEPMGMEIHAGTGKLFGSVLHATSAAAMFRASMANGVPGGRGKRAGTGRQGGPDGRELSDEESDSADEGEQSLWLSDSEDDDGDGGGNDGVGARAVKQQGSIAHPAAHADLSSSDSSQRPASAPRAARSHVPTRMADVGDFALGKSESALELHQRAAEQLATHGKLVRAHKKRLAIIMARSLAPQLPSSVGQYSAVVQELLGSRNPSKKYSGLNNLSAVAVGDVPGEREEHSLLMLHMGAAGARERQAGAWPGSRPQGPAPCPEDWPTQKPKPAMALPQLSVQTTLHAAPLAVSLLSPSPSPDGRGRFDWADRPALPAGARTAAEQLGALWLLLGALGTVETAHDHVQTAQLHSLMARCVAGADLYACMSKQQELAAQVSMVWGKGFQLRAPAAAWAGPSVEVLGLKSTRRAPDSAAAAPGSATAPGDGVESMMQALRTLPTSAASAAIASQHFPKRSLVPHGPFLHAPVPGSAWHKAGCLGMLRAYPRSARPPLPLPLLRRAVARALRAGSAQETTLALDTPHADSLHAEDALKWAEDEDRRGASELADDAALQHMAVDRPHAVAMLRAQFRGLIPTIAVATRVLALVQSVAMLDTSRHSSASRTLDILVRSNAEPAAMHSAASVMAVQDEQSPTVDMSPMATLMGSAARPAPALTTTGQLNQAFGLMRSAGKVTQRTIGQADAPPAGPRRARFWTAPLPPVFETDKLGEPATARTAQDSPSALLRKSVTTAIRRSASRKAARRSKSPSRNADPHSSRYSVASDSGSSGVSDVHDDVARIESAAAGRGAVLSALMRDSQGAVTRHGRVTAAAADAIATVSILALLKLSAAKHAAARAHQGQLLITSEALDAPLDVQEQAQTRAVALWAQRLSPVRFLAGEEAYFEHSVSLATSTQGFTHYRRYLWLQLPSISLCTALLAVANANQAGSAKQGLGLTSAPSCASPVFGARTSPTPAVPRPMSADIMLASPPRGVRRAAPGPPASRGGPLPSEHLASSRSSDSEPGFTLGTSPALLHDWVGSRRQAPGGLALLHGTAAGNGASLVPSTAGVSQHLVSEEQQHLLSELRAIVGRVESCSSEETRSEPDASSAPPDTKASPSPAKTRHQAHAASPAQADEQLAALQASTSAEAGTVRQLFAVASVAATVGQDRAAVARLAADVRDGLPAHSDTIDSQLTAVERGLMPLRAHLKRLRDQLAKAQIRRDETRAACAQLRTRLRQAGQEATLSQAETEAAECMLRQAVARRDQAHAAAAHAGRLRKQLRRTASMLHTARPSAPGYVSEISGCVDEQRRLLQQQVQHFHKLRFSLGQTAAVELPEATRALRAARQRLLQTVSDRLSILDRAAANIQRTAASTQHALHLRRTLRHQAIEQDAHRRVEAAISYAQTQAAKSTQYVQDVAASQQHAQALGMPELAKSTPIEVLRSLLAGAVAAKQAAQRALASSLAMYARLRSGLHAHEHARQAAQLARDARAPAVAAASVQDVEQVLQIQLSNVFLAHRAAHSPCGPEAASAVLLRQLATIARSLHPGVAAAVMPYHMAVAGQDAGLDPAVARITAAAQVHWANVPEAHAKLLRSLLQSLMAGQLRHAGSDVVWAAWQVMHARPPPPDTSARRSGRRVSSARWTSRARTRAR